MSSDNIYEGIALRKETVVNSPLSGYVNYFVAESGRVAVGNLVYTIDESGNLLDYLQAQGSDSFALTADDLSELRTQIVNYEASFSPDSFYTVYDFKNSLSGTITKLANAGILDNIESLSDASGTQTIPRRYAEETGIVVYSVDGFESLTAKEITPAHFDKDHYEKQQMSGNTLVQEGDAVYKLCTDDNWQLVIPVSDETAAQLTELGYVRVKFLKNQDISWAEVAEITGEEGNHFAVLAFNNAMATFCTDRFISVELLLSTQAGLKVPLSAIVDRRFFVVPKEYLVLAQDKRNAVMKRAVLEDGTQTAQVIEADIYDETETEILLDDLTVSSGDVLLKQDSEETFTVGEQATLTGVYNINKGYAEFKQIHILYQNEEYAIIESNTKYGLNVYDYIVLDAASVKENDMVYK